MNETHDLNRQLTVERPWTDPHPYDMPPAERAAYANGAGAGRRESEAEIARLRTELDAALRERDAYASELRNAKAALSRMSSPGAYQCAGEDGG